MSKLHHFINKKVIKNIYINNYRFGGDFIIFDDMSAVLVEYGDNEIYERVREGYVKKLDSRNIFIKFLHLFKKK
jgi:TM2 domain-containing membrane protein YozV